jgi:hypothetical protein
MKKFLTSFFIAINTLQVLGQCGPYFNYASCNDTVGTLYYNPSDCGTNIMVVWSTGDTTSSIVVPPGIYWAAIYENNVFSFADTLTMFHDTWQFNIFLDGPGLLHFDVYLPYCNTSIFTHPSCMPPYPTYSASLIVWEDGIPVDTLNNVFCTSWSSDWPYASPGHYYDISIYDTSCNCYQATWMTPIQTYYYPIITGYNALPAQINSMDVTFSVFNTFGQIVYSGTNRLSEGKEIAHILPPGIYFVIYYDAADNRQVLTDKIFVSDR